MSENKVSLIELLTKIIELKNQIKEIRKQITKLRKEEEKQLLTNIQKKDEKVVDKK